MESHTDRAVENGQLVKPFSARKFASHSYLNKTEHAEEVGKMTYQIREPGMWLPSGFEPALRIDGYTEIVYDVPRNTTLLNVTGPVGTGSFSCYAVLEPRPSWWGVLPRFEAGYRQSTNSTLFVFPLHPAIKYELAMGSVGSQSSFSVESDTALATCQIGGVTTYSFW